MEMNKKQRVIVFIAIVVILVMFLFPPMQTNFEHGEITNRGFDFIFFYGSRHMVNVAQLLTQWAGVLIIGVLAFFLAKD